MIGRSSDGGAVPFADLKPFWDDPDPRRERRVLPPSPRDSEVKVPMPPMELDEAERAAHANARQRVEQQAPPRARPRKSACTKICEWAQLGVGLTVKTVGCVWASRQAADIVHEALKPVIIHVGQGFGTASAALSASSVGAAVVVHAGVCDFAVRPALSALFTRFRRNPETGVTEAVRSFGRAHDPVMGLLAQLPTLFTIIHALREARDEPAGIQWNALVFAIFAEAGKTAFYVLLRGFFERCVAKYMPSRSIVDANMDPVPPEEFVKLAIPMAKRMVLFTTINGVVTADNILRRGELPAGQPREWGNTTVNMWVGVYELVVALIELLAMMHAAKQRGWSVVLNLEEDESGAPVHVELEVEMEVQAAGEQEEPLFVPGSLRWSQAREVTDSIRVRRCVLSLPASLSNLPHVFRDVLGFRLSGNGALNGIMTGEMIDYLGLLGVAGAVGGMLGPLELVPLFLVNGIYAQAFEGNADQVLFEKLHRLCKLEDGIRRANRHPCPDENTPVIWRQIDPAIMALLASKEHDDVRIHMRELRRFEQQRLSQREQPHPHAEIDPESDRVVVFHISRAGPSPAMVKELGRYLARDPLLDGSRVSGQWLRVEGEVDDDDGEVQMVSAASISAASDSGASCGA